MSVFITQGYISVDLETSLDLSGASNPKILYKTPGGQRGEWTAVISGTQLTKQLTNADIIYVGKWTFQAHVTIGGLNAYGNKVSLTFDKPLTIE